MNESNNHMSVYVLMKKAISIILILCMSLLFTSCESGPPIDKSIYASEDWSYLMVYETKYVRIEEPFIIGSKYEYPNIWYIDLQYRDIAVFTYDGTQRHPWIWISDEYFWLYDVTLPNDISIKFLNECGSYCLSEDKETIENMFSNLSWSKNVISSENKTPNCDQTILLSGKLSSFLTSLAKTFENEEKIMVFNEEYDQLITRLYQHDTQGIFKKEFGQIAIINNQFYILPGKKVQITTDRKKANYTLNDVSSLKIPEEFHDEIMTLYDTYKDANQ